MGKSGTGRKAATSSSSSSASSLEQGNGKAIEGSERRREGEHKRTSSDSFDVLATLNHLLSTLESSRTPSTSSLAVDEHEHEHSPVPSTGEAESSGTEHHGGGHHFLSARAQLAAARQQLRETIRTVSKVRRKIITGDSNKRVRDYMKEVPMVKTKDKVSFTLGVAVLMLVEYMVLQVPEHFGKFYIGLLVPLLILRFFMYYRAKKSLYMIDLCYFVNLSSMLCVFYPRLLNSRLLLVTFILANGPVGIAIVAWKNSFVFHSLDKVTSSLLHLLPVLFTYVWRWSLPGDDQVAALCEISTDHDVCGFSLNMIFFYPVIFYISWQIIFLFLTEVFFKEQLDADPTIIFSLRYLTRKKGGMNLAVRAICVKLGVMRKGEEFDDQTWKTKFIFITAQFFYTILTILPTYFYIRSKLAHTLFLLLGLFFLLWNAANFYINIFSTRYAEHLHQLFEDSGQGRQQQHPHADEARHKEKSS